MPDKDFTEQLNQWSRFQKLLATGMPYDSAYYLTFNEWHPDYENLKENQTFIIGTIEDDRVGMCAVSCLPEPSQNY